MSVQGKPRGSTLFPPDQAYAIYRGLRDEWPGIMKNLRRKATTDIETLSHEFEDLIFTKFPSGKYRIWLGRGRVIRSKSGISYPHIVMIYKPEQKRVPVILESKVKEKDPVRLDEIMASKAKASEIYDTYYNKYSKSVNVEPEDVYQVFITNASIEKEGIFYALAYGIMLISPNIPNAAVSIFEMEKMLKPKQLKKLKQSGFYSELYGLYNKLFRGRKESTKEVFSGAQIYQRLKLMCAAVTSMISKH